MSWDNLTDAQRTLFADAVQMEDEGWTALGVLYTQEDENGTSRYAVLPYDPDDEQAGDAIGVLIGAANAGIAAGTAAGTGTQAITDRSRAHTCEQCGTTFTGVRSDARYCSSACRQAAYRDR
jgi:hypothetical protein